MPAQGQQQQQGYQAVNMSHAHPKTAMITNMPKMASL